MAQKKMSADSTSKIDIAFDANGNNPYKEFRDPTRNDSPQINTYTKDDLRTYLGAIGSSEVNLRNLSRYLYYRSHIYFRLINFYASMFDLRCRKVVPKYNINKTQNKNTFLKNYVATLDQLDLMNLQGNMTEMLIRVFREDVVYAIFFQGDDGCFFYILDPDYCKIDGRYDTMDYSFAIDMSKWRSATMQSQLEWLGDPLLSMFQEYQRTGVKWQHCNDKYAACFKFRTDTWETVIPPFIALFMSLINLDDLEDVQAVADAQQIYKLVYLPMKVLSGTKQSDDFEISPDIMLKYFARLIDEALPEYVSAAPIPGDELKYIDFSDNAANDTDRVSQASNTILDTSGGGMVLNTSRITTQAGFQAALKCETEFALSPIIPQINGFANRMLLQNLGDKASKVEHFEVSVYTKDDFRKAMLESCQYSYSNKLAYNTLLGISEKDTLTMQYLEEEVLKLHDIMKYPLTSSFTQSGSGTVGEGRPESDVDELSDEGSRSRDN